MRRSCDVESYGDFIRYYQTSWIGWPSKDGGSVKPKYVHAAGREGARDEEAVGFKTLAKVGADTYNLGEVQFIPWSQVKDHAEFGVPDTGMVKDGPTIAYLAHASPRSPHKGFRPRHMRVHEFNHWNIRDRYRRSPDSYPWVWEAFNPDYAPVHRAEHRLRDGSDVGVPLTRNFGLYSLPNSRYSLLAYKCWTIGHLLNEENIQLRSQFADYQNAVEQELGVRVSV